MGNYRHIGIKVFIFLMILPFLMITDFYPFMRFGMFAEPIRNDKQLESYRLLKIVNNQSFLINTSELGISEGQFNYMSRNYFHTGKTNELLSTFWVKISSPIDSLFLLQIKGSYQKDTAIVAKYSKL